MPDSLEQALVVSKSSRESTIFWLVDKACFLSLYFRPSETSVARRRIPDDDVLNVPFRPSATEGIFQRSPLQGRYSWNVQKSMFWSNGAGILPSVQRKSGDDRLDLWKTDEVAFTLRIMNSLFQFPIHPLLLKTTRSIKWTPCSKVNCVQGYPKPSRENISQTVAFFLHVQGSVFKFFPLEMLLLSDR